MRRGLFTFFLVALFALAACGQTGGSGSAAPTAATGGGAAPTAAAGDGAAPTAAAGGAAAPAADTSLSAIKQRGKLIVGVKYDVPTFGFLNPETNKVEGFDVELGRAVAQKIFGNGEAVEFKEAVSKNRIPYLEQGVVDVVFSTMTANAERAQQIDFSDCYYVAGQSLLVQTSSDITGVDALAGKTVG
ncbi:MAG TPA: transporter substrate-binding domain-containing protein, partial [Roseiflexaceae bacterium]|nr:transporter substrate-binding domain-containing protein [Roseiflexaceae bacterium]